MTCKKNKNKNGPRSLTRLSAKRITLNEKRECDVSATRNVHAERAFCPRISGETEPLYRPALSSSGISRGTPSELESTIGRGMSFAEFQAEITRGKVPRSFLAANRSSADHRLTLLPNELRTRSNSVSFASKHCLVQAQHPSHERIQD